MSRFRLFLLGLLAVFAVGAVSAVSASAESCTGGSNVVFCASPGNTTLVGESVLGTGGLSLLASILGGATARFHCPKTDFSAVLGKLGASTGLILFLNCKEELPAKCKLTMEDELAGIDANFTAQQKNATLATFTGSGTGGLFATLHVENEPGQTCAATGAFEVTGSQLVETPTGGTGKVEQEIVAKKSGSSLKLGSQVASFSGTAQAMLGGGSAWLVMTAGV